MMAPPQIPAFYGITRVFSAGFTAEELVLWHGAGPQMAQPGQC